MKGPIGYETAARLLREHGEELHRRFSGVFLQAFERIGEDISEDGVLPSEPGLSGDPAAGLIYAAELGEDGLTGALWAACETLSLDGYHGCRVFLESIPVRQEVVEVTELYDENPYESASRGAWLLIWDEDVRMSRMLQQEEETGIGNSGCTSETAPPGTVPIGYLTKDRKRLLIGQELTRFLTPPDRQHKDTEGRKATRHRS